MNLPEVVDVPTLQTLKGFFNTIGVAVLFVQHIIDLKLSNIKESN